MVFIKEIDVPASPSTKCPNFHGTEHVNFFKRFHFSVVSISYVKLETTTLRSRVSILYQPSQAGASKNGQVDVHYWRNTVFYFL